MKALKIVFFSIIALLGLFSIACFLYPTVSNLINEHYNESRINEYNGIVNSSSETEIRAALFDAEQYNKILATDYSLNDSQAYEQVLNNYYHILDVNDGIMGYIEIPSINVKLSIYHGENEDVLKKGAAHMEGTSFPIGSADSHACISAHSGFPTQKFFDNIDELVEGDKIYIKVLNQTITYTVSGREIIEPNDTSKLKIEKGKNVLTLITCYPYGINSHRLLVHAKYTETENNSQATADEIQIHSNAKSNHYISIMPLIIVCVAIMSILCLIILTSKKKARK